mgnify:CR=1 FL=1
MASHERERGRPPVNITVPARYLQSRTALERSDLDRAATPLVEVPRRLDRETVDEIATFESR